MPDGDAASERLLFLLAVSCGYGLQWSTVGVAFPSSGNNSSIRDTIGLFSLSGLLVIGEYVAGSELSLYP